MALHPIRDNQRSLPNIPELLRGLRPRQGIDPSTGRSLSNSIARVSQTRPPSGVPQLQRNVQLPQQPNPINNKVIPNIDPRQSRLPNRFSQPQPQNLPTVPTRSTLDDPKSRVLRFMQTFMSR